MGRSPMHRLWDTLKVLPIFALLRADRSVYRSAASHVSNSKLRFALSFHPLFVGGNPFTVTSMWGLVNYLEHRFGVYYIHGGAQAMANKMAEKIKSLILRMKAGLQPIFRREDASEFIKSND